jgi:hypothetical protein
LGWLLGMVLLTAPAHAEVMLTVARTPARHPSGDPIWQLQLVDGHRVLRRWAAASGRRDRQGADRLWSPGNAAPLPPGRYRVGRPEPWGQDLWIELQPTFATSRSGLGIHHCFPGVGCLCLRERPGLDTLAALIGRHRVRTLVVQN